MKLKNFLTNISVDHASLWLHLFNFYFYNFTPYFVYVPKRMYKKVFATFGIITVCHICLNVVRYLKNKDKITDRRERARLNCEELKDIIESTMVPDAIDLNVTDMPFDELSAKLKSGDLDPHAVLVAFQQRALENSDSNAVAEYILDKEVPTLSEETRELHGLPVSISELIELHEKDRTVGLGGFVNIPAKSDALIVKLLKACGAVPFIRTNISQALPFCPSMSSSNPIFGHTSHPFSRERSAGGGSCGEACLLSLNASVLGVGADLVGGVRIPAHFCGVAALRTTPQRVSTQGLMQGQSLVPTCVGPMSRDVSGLTAFMRSVCGPQQTDLDPSIPQRPFDDEVFSSTEPLRIGFYVEDGYTRTTPAVSRAVLVAKKYLERKGHTLVPFTPPDMRNMLSDLLYPAAMGSNYVLWQLLSIDQVDKSIRRLFYRIQVNNALRWIFSWWKSSESPVEAALEAAYLPLTMEDWWHLSNEIQDFRQKFCQKWKQARLDVLLGPVMPCSAVKPGHETRLLACLTHVGLFSLLNFPAGTVPVTNVKQSDLLQFQSSSSYLAQSALDHYIMQDQIGQEADTESSVLGYPVGVQLAALPYQEELVLRVMRDIEEARTRPSMSSNLSFISTASQRQANKGRSDSTASKQSDTRVELSASQPMMSVSLSKVKSRTASRSSSYRWSTLLEGDSPEEPETPDLSSSIDSTSKKEDKNQLSDKVVDSTQKKSVTEKDSAPKVSNTKRDSPSPPKVSLIKKDSPSKASLTNKDSPPKVSLTNKDSPPKASLTNKDSPPKVSLQNKDSPSKASLTNKDSPPKASLTNKDSPPKASLTRKDSPPKVSPTKKDSLPIASLTNKDLEPRVSLTNKDSPPKASLTNKDSPQKASLTRKDSPPKVSPTKKDSLPIAPLTKKDSKLKISITNRDSLPKVFPTTK